MGEKQEQNHDYEICGCETYEGEPCTRPAGWGTEEDGGPCKYHIEGSKDHIKEEILEIYQKKALTLEELCREVDIARSTLWDYRQHDEDFAEKFDEVQAEQDRRRTQMVEDTMFRRIINGDATAGEIKYWLWNRAPGRWSKKADSQVNIAQKIEQPDINEREEQIRQMVKEGYDKLKEKSRLEAE